MANNPPPMPIIMVVIVVPIIPAMIAVPIITTMVIIGRC